MVTCQLWENKPCRLSHSEVLFFWGLCFSGGFGGYFSFRSSTKQWILFSHRWMNKDTVWAMTLSLFPFMQTSAKFSNVLRPSYTLGESKLTLVGLVSHWLSTSMERFLLVVVEILFSRHKQFWRFEEQILLLMLGLLNFTSGLITINIEC